MCLINNNIVETESKERKRKSDITYEERVKIEYMLKKKYTMEEMSEELGRNKSIISREINRHCEIKWNYETGIKRKVYSSAKAQGKYEYSKKKAGRKSKLSRALKQFIEDKILKEKWSPEEVAGYIKAKDIKFEIQPSFQTIYYWIETKKLKVTATDLVHKAKLKKKKKTKKVEKLPKHKEKSIHNRPKEIDEKREFGHWELDCVEGAKGSQKTYMTLLERITKKYIVIEMEEHTNECVKKAIDSLEEKYGEKFKKIFKSMTTDNGHEFLNYDKIEISKYNEEERRTKVYYADAYSSWQKGMNENCNGILRRFIPKGTDLKRISQAKLEEIVKKINGKPRKILGFISAEARFNEEILKIVA